MNSALIVLGMHRSGTSVTAGLLHHLGFSVGKHLLDPAEDNRTGYWENAAIVQMNDRILRAADSSWDDTRRCPLSDAEGVVDQDELREVLRGEFGNSGRIALKDPRMCLVSCRWVSALQAEGYRVDAVVVRRHPDAVVQSLDRRDGIHPVIGYLLYSRYMLAAVRGASRVRARTALDYEFFLSDWRRALGAVFDQLGISDIPLSGEIAGRVGAFVDAGMSHARPSDIPAPESDARMLREIAMRVYGVAGQVGSWTGDVVDELEHALQEALSRLTEAARARLDTHRRWRVRHDQEVSRLRDLFDANLDQLRRTDAGVAEARALAERRLELIHEQESRLVHLNERIDSLATESMERLELIHEQESRLVHLHETIDRLTTESVRRLRLAEERDAEAIKLTRALDEVTQLSLERLDQIHQQERRIQEYDDALNRVTALAADRLSRLKEFEAALGGTDVPAPDGRRALD